MTWCRTSRHSQQYGKSSKHIQESGKVEWGRAAGDSSYGHEIEATWCITSRHSQQYGKSSMYIQRSRKIPWFREAGAQSHEYKNKKRKKLKLKNFNTNVVFIFQHKYDELGTVKIWSRGRSGVRTEHWRSRLWTNVASTLMLHPHLLGSVVR